MKRYCRRYQTIPFKNIYLKHNRHCRLQLGMMRTLTSGSKYRNWQKTNGVSSWMPIHPNVKAANRVVVVAAVAAEEQTLAAKKSVPKVSYWIYERRFVARGSLPQLLS